MVLIDLQKVLAALGLVSSITKPIPIVGGIASGLVDTVGGVANSTLGSSGPVGSLLGPLVGGLVAAVGVGSNDTDTDAGSSSGANNGTSTSTSTDTGNENDNGNGNGNGNTTTTYSAASDDSNDNDSCAFQPYTPATPVQLESFAPYDAAQALIYRYRQQQSVNLGSWFVQEQWMNPSLFACASGNKQAELDVAQGWGGVDGAKQVLERHWDEWIGESDFAYLAGIGINTVRLPIGYWNLGPVYCQGTPFESVASVYVNSWARVVRAINWAEKYGLGVLVDLHGAPGSQNGQAHSGVSDGQQNLFGNPANVQLTMNALTYLTQQLVKVNNVVGIEILNEPSNVDGLPAFYSQALTTLRQVSPEAAAFPFYIQDGFDMSRFADYISTRNDFVVLDHHSYFVFGDHDSQEIPAQQLTSTLKPGQGSLSQQMISAAAEERRNIVIGEFSCALSGDALVNATNSATDRRRFCTGQMESYTNATAGWSFWSYKTEGCDGDDNWCFTHAVGNSLPSTFFSYPNSTVAAAAAAPSTSDAAAAVGSGTNFLSFGTSSPSDDQPGSLDYDAILAALGADDSQANLMNEAFATTEYDMVPQGDADDNTAASSPSASPETTPSSPDSSIGAQAAFAADPMLNTATIPSSRMDLVHQGNRKRSLGLSDLPQRAFLWSSSIAQHRFVARHSRVARRSHAGKHARRDDSSDAGTNAYTPEQTAIAKGYSDGWKAAKTFANFNGSRLGFSGQFVSDAISAMNGKILSGDEQSYRQWFMKGLVDGELQVIKMLALQSQGPQ